MKFYKANHSTCCRLEMA